VQAAVKRQSSTGVIFSTDVRPHGVTHDFLNLVELASTLTGDLAGNLRGEGPR
jgi:hypothetical protein